MVLLDLHFILRNFNEDKNFIIGKDNYQVYEIFDELYKEIVNTKVSDNLKDVYHQLVKSSIITWKHDDYPEDLAPSMQIIPLENAYVLKFNEPKCEESDELVFYPRMKNTIEIRIRNSGTRYPTFNVPFMKAYHKLCELKTPHQVHIEEYLIDEKISKGESLSRILKKQR